MRLESTAVRLLRSTLERGSITRGVEAILDQATFAGSTLVIYLALARWMNPAQYGSFTVGYSVVLLFLAGHQAYVQQPFLVFGAGRYRNFLRGAWTYLAARQALLVAGLGVAGMGIYVAIVEVGTSHSALPLNVALATFMAALGICSMHFFRRTWHVLQEHSRAITGAVLYPLIAISGIAILKSVGLLTAATALLGIGASAGGVAALWFVRQHQILPNDEEPLDRSTFARDVHNFGRWALPAQFATWGLNNGPYLLVAGLMSLQAVGTLRAAANLLLPFLHLMVGLSNWFVPHLSELRLANGRIGWKEVRAMLATSTAVSVLYGGVVVASARWISVHLYESKYEIQPVILFGALLPVAWAIIGVAFAALRSLEHARAVFLLTLGALIVGVPLMVGATAMYGVGALMLTWTFSQLVLAGMSMMTLARLLRTAEASMRD